MFEISNYIPVYHSDSKINGIGVFTPVELQDDEFSMYPELIQKSFGFDNETVFGYRVIENNVTVTILNSAWHYKLTGYDDEIPDFAELIHFINKRFDLWWPNENNNS